MIMNSGLRSGFLYRHIILLLTNVVTSDFNVSKFWCLEVLVI